MKSTISIGEKSAIFARGKGAKWTVEIREIIGLKALEINVWIFAVLGENRNYYDCSHASEENRSYAPFHIFSSRQYKCQIIKNQS